METSRSSPAWLARSGIPISMALIREDHRARFLGERLERLCMSQCFIGHEGLLAIATQCSLRASIHRYLRRLLPTIMPKPSGLLEVDLSIFIPGEDGIPGKAMRAICQRCTRLEKRNPDGNHLGDKNVAHIVSCDRLQHLRLQVNNLTDAVVPAPMRLRHLSTLALVSNDGQSFRDCVPVRPRVRERTETQSYSKTRGDSAAVDGAHARTQPVRRTHNGDRVRRGAPIRARASAEIAYSK